ncbi:MAG: B12-binding domain-containing radical SAM protein [Acidobacteria bacterium]|uniref:B12-binding domain-containing radical SAM protein n=1 Tax=Candidatus Polarisedimenticola svalbardensis TaxID=2886004 RepID=A0A8J6Y4H7_9BACT|nr:B12-binding domain-containing radical SAM protein [Candidatus Polarisedimenticola svalbardensis]
MYRPPSEADSLILQATIGCSYNECTFCAMYRDKNFRVRPFDELREEIVWAGEHVPGVRKVFLADGDALVAKASYLHRLLDELNRTFPTLRRVSVYASPQSIQVRTVEEMRSLREAGLSLYYLGIESGDDQALEDMKKGVTADEMIECGRKVHEAGVRLSTMILLGAAGRKRSRTHAEASARVVNAIQPRFVSTLVMSPVPGTPLGDRDDRGEFEHLTPVELAAELRVFLAGLELNGTIFRSNHASNYLALAGTLPKDRDRMVQALDGVLNDPENASFRPDWMRGL